MTPDKALDLLATHVAYLNGNVGEHDAPSRHKLQQALQALERFRGAVEVKCASSSCWIDAPVSTNTLYAIQKEN